MFNLKPPRVSILTTRKFDLISSWGTEGRGPGEFIVTNSWVGFRDSVVYVFQGHRTSLFTLQGKYLDSDHPEKRTPWAISRVDWTSGVDDKGNCYFWDEGLGASHVVIRRTREGKIQKLIYRKELPLQLESFSELAVRFGVLRNGEIVAAFGKEPFVLRADTNGTIRWIRNIVQLLPMLRTTYHAVAKKEIQFPLTAFWTDKKYTILAYANPTPKRKQPTNFFVILDSEMGEVLHVVYARENVRKLLPESVDVDNDESISFVPSEIARSGNYLFVYSINSSRLRKYELLWQ